MTDERPIATPSQTVGPFFSFGLTTNAALGQLARSGAVGAAVHLRVRVLDGDGQPVPDSCIEAWHADASGAMLFGRLPTDAAGACAFETVVPGQTAPDAPHVNLCVFMRGLLRHMYTRAYLAEADDVTDDPVLALVPAARRETLLARRVPESPDRWTFDIHLQGDRETVFFDL